MKKTLPTDQDIMHKKGLFSEGVRSALEQPRKTVKVTVRDKLRLLNDELIRFKGSGISYQIICRLLADKLGLLVSEQTLREHCQRELGFVKRETEQRGGTITPPPSEHGAQRDHRFVSGQMPARVIAPDHPIAGSNEIEQASSINKQPFTGQGEAQSTQQVIEKISNKIAIQTEKLYKNLEDY